MDMGKSKMSFSVSKTDHFVSNSNIGLLELLVLYHLSSASFNTAVLAKPTSVPVAFGLKSCQVQNSQYSFSPLQPASNIYKQSPICERIRLNTDGRK